MSKKPFVTKEQIEKIVELYPTPFHIYDEKGIRENAKALKEAFSWNKGFKEYFAVKATPNPYLIDILREVGCGCDCSSMTELMLSEAMGLSGEDIMFSSNETPAEEYAYAYKLGAIINLDDITHIDFLENIVGQLPETMSCRYNPGGVFKISNSIMDNPGDAKYGLAPASLTKVLTAVVALEEGNLEDIITVTKDVKITESGATLCGLKEGDTLTLNQALHALLIQSANDAANAIAIHLGGSLEGFATLMNQKAVELGATNSHFVNPHGLSDDDHYTTAYDLYLIFNKAIEYELFREIIHMDNYSTIYQDSVGNDKEMEFSTTNLFLRGNYNSPDKVTVIGGKTGTTNAAGNCLIVLTKDTAGNPYISVILRSKERQLMYEQMIDLLEEIYN